MIEIIKELKIEVSKPNIFQAVVAKQYDMNTRFIKATLVDGADVIYIPNDPDKSVKVVINAERPDGQSKGFDGVVNEDGTVTVPLHSWMLELEGTVICDISVIDTEADDNKKLTTTSFTLLVEKASYGGGDITNDPQYDVLVTLVETCTEASAAAKEALTKSNEALEKSNEANSKYNACVEATENANAVREEIEAGGYIESLKEMNNGGKFSFWVGTQEQYDKIGPKTENCFYIITDDTTEKDYIVEQGVSGMWTYRKWASGIAECWGVQDVDVPSVTKEWGQSDSIVYYSDSFGFKEYPFVFSSEPLVNFSFLEAENKGLIVLHHSFSPSQKYFTPSLFAYSHRAYPTITKGYINWSIKGKWK